MDSQIVVIEKPAGMSTIPYDEQEKGNAMHRVYRALAARKRNPGGPLHIVHRIDKATSGLLVFARTKQAQMGLKDQLRDHSMEREYRCLANGELAERTIDSDLHVDRGDGLRGTNIKKEGGKRSVTHIVAVEPLGEATLCTVRLETGRTHQIRIHLSEKGHPVVGDMVYVRDSRRHNESVLEAPRMMLHAATLGFEHPTTRRPMRFESPLPEDFVSFVNALRTKAGVASEGSPEPESVPSA